MTWTLTLPMLPMSGNKRDTTHWTKRHRERKQIGTAIGWLLLEQRVSPAMGKRRVTITIHKTKRSRRLDDQPNLDGRSKAILDALVEHSALIDDSPMWLDFPRVIEGEKRDTEQTVITIEDCQ